MRVASVVLVLLVFAGPCLASREATAADSLESRVRELRLEARFADASDVANELLALRRSDPAARPFEVRDAERLVETLRYIASLPPEAQRELASADSLGDAGGWLRYEGQYEEAAGAIERQLAIRRRLLGGEHLDVAQSLLDLGDALESGWSPARAASAESLYRRALEIRRGALGDEHPDVAHAIFMLAGLLTWRQDYDRADALYRESLAMYQRVYGAVHADIAQVLNDLGYLQAKIGDFEETERLYREALAMRLAILGPEHEYTALTMSNLAWLLLQRGDYESAEPLSRQAVAVARRRLGSSDMSVASKLAVLAIILNRQGNKEEAEPLLREALGIARAAPASERWRVASHAYNLAWQLIETGEYAEAESLLLEALAIHTEFFGADHANVASTLNSLSDVLRLRGDLEEAEARSSEALAIYRRLHGDDHARVASSLCRLADVRQAAGDYEGVRGIYEEALTIYERDLGEEHPRTLRVLHGISSALWAMGEERKAEEYFARTAEFHDAARLRAGRGLARSMFADSPYEELAALRLARGDSEGAWPAAEKSLALGLADLLRSAEERELTAAEAAREDSLRDRLGDLEREVATLREAARADSSAEAAARAEEARDRLLEAEASWSAFEREIAAKYPVTEGEIFPRGRVQSTLDAGTALVGWLDVEGGEEQHAWCYAIRNTGPVAWARAGTRSLGDGGMTPRAFSEAYRRSLMDPGTSAIAVGRESRALWSDRIGPLADALEGVTDLVVLPSGAMLGVPVEAFIDDAGVTVGERYTVSYAPSATLHTWFSERGGETGTGILLVGDPPFSEAQQSAIEGGEPVLLASVDGPATSVLVRSALGGNAEALSSLPRLAGTREEVSAIAGVFGDASVLLGADASEQRLIGLAESGELGCYGTIHIATHALVDDERPERSALVLSQAGLPDPLESAMTGTRIYDGLVSAKEIVREWDLSADLVTLSACETGLGKEVGGEGYVGFAHAFLQAGARSLLVSLWKVEDRATSLLMRRFYESRSGRYEGERAGRRGEPLTKPLALREAKAWLRSYEDEAGRRPYEHPYYWSAFVLIGGRS